MLEIMLSKLHVTSLAMYRQIRNNSAPGSFLTTAAEGGVKRSVSQEQQSRLRTPKKQKKKNPHRA